MSILESIPASGLVGAGIALFLISRWRSSSKLSGLPLPPGPKRRFLVGNLLDVPPDFAWVKYHDWAKEHESDIIYLNLAGQHIVVLDTYEACLELLEKRSGIYSSRPRMPMINELMGWEFDFGFMQYGELWRQHRKIAHNAFHPTVIKQYRPHELRAARGLLRRLLALSDSDGAMREIRQFAGEIVISISYGVDVLPRDDPYVKLAEEGMQPLSSVAPGSYLVDAIPALKYVPDWFPGAEFKRKAKVWREKAERMIEIPFRDTKRNINNGTVKPCIMRDGFERMREKDDAAYTEENLKCVAGTMYAAGSDTTIAVISWALVGLLMNPECIAKAQKELDTVLKPGMLPDFEDEEALPYMQAIVREALRWHDVVPIAIPHYLDEEDEYKGYRIPAGTIVIPNSWAILHDENRYPEPFKFNPDRHMKDGKLNDDVLDPGNAAFGYGRRVCPGRYVATSSVWITLASMLAVFDITKPLDKDGKAVEPVDEGLPGLIVFPKSLQCDFKPRSKAAYELVRSTANEELVLFTLLR
ncbi:cytochrome P450 [Cyathus striatus]|nr:cytochrome P450 [Cyathus striatus]